MEPVLRQSSCDGEAPLQLLHLSLWVLHLRALKNKRGQVSFSAASLNQEQMILSAEKET
jgi:hypothetical protein